MDQVPAVQDRQQEQECFLNIRREEIEIHYLRHSGLRDVGEAGQLGHVRDGSLTD